MQATSFINHFHRSKLIPARGTSGMRGALMESKDWNKKEETVERGNGDGSFNALYKNVSSGKGDILSVTTKKRRRSGDKLQYRANGRVFERAQFVVSNKGHWSSTVWAHCPIAG